MRVAALNSRLCPSHFEGCPPSGPRRKGWGRVGDSWLAPSRAEIYRYSEGGGPTAAQEQVTRTYTKLPSGEHRALCTAQKDRAYMTFLARLGIFSVDFCSFLGSSSATYCYVTSSTLTAALAFFSVCFVRKSRSRQPAYLFALPPETANGGQIKEQRAGEFPGDKV
jgi:hypothetical protein